MEESIFAPENGRPTEKQLKLKLANAYPIWTDLVSKVLGRSVALSEEWKQSTKKSGWTYRIRDKRRVIIYFIPHEGYFEVAFVFGNKATEQIYKSSVDPAIKENLRVARQYPEGRVIGVVIKDKTVLPDLTALIEIKLGN